MASTGEACLAHVSSRCPGEEGSGCDAGADCAPANVSSWEPSEGALDECPSDPNKHQPGACGCGVPDNDTDRDGTADCEDGCPRDEHKTAAGICGCGAPDSDEDSDRTPDCLDACPRDGNKTAVGMCGCGIADSDKDEDGTVDCIDECPSDPSRTTAGALGCGPFALLHRYTFDGSGVEARDVVGNATATLSDACGSSQRDGALQLAGDKGEGSDSECYVSLPHAAWPATAGATFEVWITWHGQAASGSATWQRVFDFGNQVSEEGETYLCLMPSGDDNVRAEFSVGGDDEQVFIESAQPLSQNVIKHLAVVIDDRASMTLYVDGVDQGSVALPAKLTKIEPKALWLGRSTFVRDPAFFGKVHEFRIYGVALSAAQIRKTADAGPDHAPLP
ncbi:MAG TPA: LamG domain-containing protein [Polyangiales bacterium]|nr:LamG domain-containing protein [Polyangiales bacterium]